MKSWWVAGVRVDESNTRLIALGTGPHTVRFFGRQPGARIERFTLVPAQAAGR